MNNYRIYGQFTTKSPLSHISESISTTSYLVQEPILQEDGEIEEVFCYNGNAWRGQLRDLCATYLLNKLNVQVSLDAFHLLFTGGKIGGDQSIDIEQAKLMRKVVPMVSLFGGGVGNQILAGKMKVGNSYPVCQEALPVISFEYREKAKKISYKDLTFEKSFTRFDDIKDLDKQELLSAGGKLLLTDGSGKKKKDGDVSTQMRMSSELLVSGTTLVHEIDLVNVSEVELGALISGLTLFAQVPYIGGQSNKGHGRVDYVAKIVNMSTGKSSHLTWVRNGIELGEFARQALESYDNYLLTMYNTFLEKKASEITKMLGATHVADNA